MHENPKTAEYMIIAGGDVLADTQHTTARPHIPCPLKFFNAYYQSAFGSYFLLL